MSVMRLGTPVPGCVERGGPAGVEVLVVWSFSFRFFLAFP